jgi:hypothetical protein
VLAILVGESWHFIRDRTQQEDRSVGVDNDKRESLARSEQQAIPLVDGESISKDLTDHEAAREVGQTARRSIDTHQLNISRQ